MSCMECRYVISAYKNNWEILPALRSGVRLPQPAECPIVEMHRIMLRCWEFEPSDRPTFAELKVSEAVAAQN